MSLYKYFSRAMAAAMLAERAHQTLSAYSPQYATWVHNNVNKMKRKLGLSYTVEDEVRKYLEVGEDEETGYMQCSFSPVQTSIANMYLYENLEVVKVISTKGLDAGGLNLENIIEEGFAMENWARPVLPRPKEMRECEEVDHARVQGREFATPRERLGIDGDGKRALIQGSAMGLRPIYMTFAKYGDVKIVIQLNTSYSGLSYRYNLKDSKALAPFYDELTRISMEESTLKGLVGKFMTGMGMMTDRPVESFKSIRSVEKLFETVASHSIDIGIDKKASLDLRYGIRDIDFSLFSNEIQNLLQRDLPGFIGQMDAFCEEGYDGRRAYLLEGEPGTGKSYLIKTIVSSLPENFTTILIEKDSINRLLEISSVSYLFPALVVIEDIDLLLDNRERQQTLLNFLDGIFAPQKMLTLMTSNNLSDVADAIKNRPGRVDRIIKVVPGDERQRLAQLKSLTRKMDVPIDLEEIAARTEGLTVAQLKELIRRSRIYTQNYSGTIERDAMDAVIREYEENKIIKEKD